MEERLEHWKERCAFSCEGERKDGSEGEGEKEGGRKEGKEGGREEGRKEGGREEGRKGGKREERGREGGREGGVVVYDKRKTYYDVPTFSPEWRQTQVVCG